MKSLAGRETYWEGTCENMINVPTHMHYLLCRQPNTVQASDVVITDTRDSGSGLEVQFYVRGMRGGVIPASAIVPAIQVMAYTAWCHYYVCRALVDVTVIEDCESPCKSGVLVPHYF